jgi:predicted nucleotide-binding protein
MGLPTPHAPMHPSGAMPILDAGFRRAIDERCKWLSEAIKNVMKVEAQEAGTPTKPPPSPRSGKASIFIGSSKEGLKYARALEQQLEHHTDVTIWKDGAFGLGSGNLEALVNALPDYDFAALVLTPDDMTESRDVSQPSPRDNVVFEVGLFMGRLGRFRTFVVYNSDSGIKLPSDLAGVTHATFRDRADHNYHAQLSSPSTSILDAIDKQGRFSPH